VREEEFEEELDESFFAAAVSEVVEDEVSTWMVLGLTGTGVCANTHEERRSTVTKIGVDHLHRGVADFANSIVVMRDL
jgi:hypothetical protein